MHFVSTPLVLSENENELVLGSRRRRVFNPLFVTGCVLFIASMFLKANVDNRLAAIPLGISSIVLLAGVWHLSANGLVVFNRRAQKVFRVYTHLGYVQKVYETPMQSIETVVLQNGKIYLQLDNLKSVLISSDVITEMQINALVDRINRFLAMQE